MSRKTEVMRLTAEEASLVGVLRGIGLSRTLECLDTAIGSVPVESSEFLRSARAALKPTVYMTLDDLVKMGAISEEDASLLRTALSENTNIAVTGIEGSGKTTFLKSLIGAMDVRHRVYVLENHEEIEVKEFAPDKNISSMKLGALSGREIVGKVLQAPVDKLVFGEIISGEDVSSLAVSILCGHSVVFSTYAETEDDVIDVLTNLNKNVKSRFIDALKQSEFVVVRCELSEGGKRSFFVQK